MFRFARATRCKVLGEIHLHTLETSNCLVMNAVGVISALIDLQTTVMEEEGMRELSAVHHYFGIYRSSISHSFVL